MEERVYEEKFDIFLIYEFILYKCVEILGYCYGLCS